MGELKPYNRDKGLTWTGYMAGQLFALSGMAIIAKSVESGIRTDLSKISDGIDEIGADFNLGMSLVISQLQAQQRIFEDILDKLDQIHKTLKSPLLTQARESYRMGLDRLGRGLLDKSLEAFLESEKKNDTDFVVQFQIGKLYLYGKDEDDDIINLDKAEEHLKQACRYAEAEVKFLTNERNTDILPKVKQLCGETFFNTGVLYLIKGNEDFLNGRDGKSFYQQGFSWFEKATSMYPEFLETFYYSAKCLSLLGDKAKCIEYFKKAVEHDMKYLKKIELDKDFDFVREDIKTKLREVINKELEIMKNDASAKYKELKTLTSDVDLFLGILRKMKLGIHIAHSFNYYWEVNGQFPDSWDWLKESEKQILEDLFGIPPILITRQTWVVSRAIKPPVDIEVFIKALNAKSSTKEWAQEIGWTEYVFDEELSRKNSIKNGLVLDLSNLSEKVELLMTKDNIIDYKNIIDLISENLSKCKDRFSKIKPALENILFEKQEEKEVEEHQKKMSNDQKVEKGMCFIATASYGSEYNPKVQFLRYFRDKYLLKNYFGSVFIRFYYFLSPPIAYWIGSSESRKKYIRHVLDKIIDILNGMGV